jgi:hypothetical protein
MEKVSLTNSLRNAKVLHRVKEERNIMDTIIGRMANWIGHTLRLLKHTVEGKIDGAIEVTDRQGKIMLTSY